MDDLRVLSEQEIVAHVPYFLNPKRNWSGKCEAAAFNLCDVFTSSYVRNFADATSARKASKIQGPGFGPAGSWVWMSGVFGIDDNGRRVDFGHVAYHMGNNLLFMASSAVRAIRGFTALGFIDGNEYLRRFSNQKLQGWSYDHGGTILTEEFMNADDKRWLESQFKGVYNYIDSVLGIVRDGDRDHDNLGSHITNEVNRIFQMLNSIITREGKGARVYENSSTGEVVLLSSVGHWWLPIGKDGAQATINILVDRGWSQRWEERKTLDDLAFKQMLRFFNNISEADIPNDGSQPLPLGPVTPVQG